MHEDCLCLLGHHIQINIFIFSVILPLGLGSCWRCLSIYKLPLLIWTQSTTEASHFHNWSSAQPLMTSSHCFLHYTRELHLSHIQRTQGRLELCFRCLKEIHFPHLAHTYAKHSCTAGLPCLSKEYTAIVSVFTLDTLHRWPNGAVAVQITLARNPEGSGVETNNSTPNKVVFTTWVFNFNSLPEFDTWSQNQVTQSSERNFFFYTKAQFVHNQYTLQTEEVT